MPLSSLRWSQRHDLQSLTTISVSVLSSTHIRSNGVNPDPSLSPCEKAPQRPKEPQGECALTGGEVTRETLDSTEKRIGPYGRGVHDPSVNTCDRMTLDGFGWSEQSLSIEVVTPILVCKVWSNGRERHYKFHYNFFQNIYLFWYCMAVSHNILIRGFDFLRVIFQSRAVMSNSHY